jgi:hypothetical protein
MLKKILFVLALVAVPTAAFAQGDDTAGGGGGGGGATTGTAPAAEPPAAPMGESPAIFKHGTWGLSFPVTSLLTITGLTATPTVPTISFLMFQNDKAALDILLGVQLLKTSDNPTAVPPVVGATTFGFAAGLGYRIYQHHSARIHTFVEPFAKIAVTDVSSFADVLTISAGANLGAECMFTEWFSVSGTIGLQANFANKFKDINVGTVTGGLFANFYWD